MLISLTLACQNWSYLFSFADFGQATVILVSLDKRGGEKQSKLSQFDKNLRTKHRIWYFSKYFQWFNQRESRTGFLSQQIGFKGLVIYFCNKFSWFLQQNKICVIRIRTQRVLQEISSKWLLFLAVLARAVFRTQSKVNGGAFFVKIVNNF